MKMDTPNGLAVNPKPTAVILAGGRSTRFGSDKAMANINGRPMIQILADQLGEAGFSIFISTNHEAHHQLSYPVLKDAVPFSGPLFALQDIFHQLEVSKILLAACDAPFLKPELIQWFWKQSDEWDVSVLEDDKKILSPLPGIYSRKVLDSLEKLIHQGKKSLKSLFDCGLKVNHIPWQDWGVLDPQHRALFNINTPKIPHSE